MTASHYLIFRGTTDATTKRTTVIASTATPDRYDDIVDQATWRLDNYRANPVIPWGHDYSLPPVGRAESVSLVAGNLQAEIVWDDAETNPLGRTVAAQFAGGFLSAVSVGFRPGRQIQRSQLAKDDARYKEAGYGAVFFDCDLLEISAVCVPANPDALAQRGLPPQRLTEPEAKALLRAELLRLIGADADVQRALDLRALATIDGSAALRQTVAREAEAEVMRRMFAVR